MIKIFAAFFMLVDHVGAILFPQNVFLRLLGRFSMPLFAYCVARGFVYAESKQKEGLTKYTLNIALFALVSQISFVFFRPELLNIGFTWLLSILVLAALNKHIHWLFGLLFLIIGMMLPVDYGLYGVLYPVMFYYLMVKANKPLLAFAESAILFLMYTLLISNYSLQFVSILAVPLIVFLKKHDNLLRLHKNFFYIFYPAHIMFLVIVQQIIELYF